MLQESFSLICTLILWKYFLEARLNYVLSAELVVVNVPYSQLT